MTRIPLLGRLRVRHRVRDSETHQPAPPRLRRRAPSPGALRRERRAILRARDEMIRDLGGLALEMYRRDQFREDLLAERARDIVNLELRVAELDSMLEAAAAGHRAAGRCECGAPILWGSHFCANCGRPVGAEPVVACESCGHPLPADAEFCPSCGAVAQFPSDDEAASQDGDATVIGAGGLGADPKRESWES